MAKRTRLVPAPSNSYFTSEKQDVKFTGTGCAVLDSALGGGWAIGHTANIVGDKSTSKTGLATEALINFLEEYPDGKAAYRETEAAFDKGYAAAMGLPINKIDFGDKIDPLLTVESFINDFEDFLNKQIKAKKPGIYVLDSLDALSDEEEMANSVDKGTYGMAKAKKLGIMFRKLTRKQEIANVLLLIVSQVRENIGVAFGEKYRRSGGKALDFYASQIVWLAYTGELKRTIKGVELPYGIEIKAHVKKNKVGLPKRKCDFIFEFGFGVNDLLASVTWLKRVNHLSAINVTNDEYKDYLKSINEMPTDEYRKERKIAAIAVKKIWRDIDEESLPKRSKY